MTKKGKKGNNNYMGQKQQQNNKQQDSSILPDHVNISVNDVNAPIKMLFVKLGKKANPITCCLQEIHFKYRNTNN